MAVDYTAVPVTCDECGDTIFSGTPVKFTREGHPVHPRCSDTTLAEAWDEGCNFTRRHPGMAAEYFARANPYQESNS